MPESTLSPTQGLRIWPQEIFVLQVLMERFCYCCGNVRYWSFTGFQGVVNIGEIEKTPNFLLKKSCVPYPRTKNPDLDPDPPWDPVLDPQKCWKSTPKLVSKCTSTPCPHVLQKCSLKHTHYWDPFKNSGTVYLPRFNNLGYTIMWSIFARVSLEFLFMRTSVIVFLFQLKYLKVLSSEMDPAEIRLIRRTLLKESSRRGFSKILPSPIDWEPFNSRAPSRTVIGY